jgi:hypothetical protein
VNSLRGGLSGIVTPSPATSPPAEKEEELRDAQPYAGPSSVTLFDELDNLFARFVAFGSDEARHAVVLWVAHAHTLKAYESTPRLAMLSPEKGSGKTRTLEVLGLVVPEALHAVNMSPAALYRVVALRRPTLLMDEADTYLGAAVAKQHEDLRGLINAGHRRGAKVYRAEVSGKEIKVVEFEAFAACALAGIGDLPDTILDRSIVIAMKRRAPGETVEPFRERKVRPETSALLKHLTAWGAANVAALTDAWPEMPPGITDRPADVWEPLIACADAIGGHWPERARQACVVLNAAREDRDPSLGVLMLSDCRQIFATRDVDRLTSESLVEYLCQLDESPWNDLRGKPVDKAKVAKFLRRFDIKPNHHRFASGTKRGYLLEDFEDAWARYLPAPSNSDVTGVTGVTDS